MFLKIFKFIYLFLSLIYFYPQSMWDLGSPTRDRTHTPYTGIVEF